MSGRIRAGLSGGIVVAIVMALAAPTVAAETSNIRGRVLDSGGKPVEGAEVFLVDPRPFDPIVVATARSDATGTFGFRAELPKDSLANPFYCQTLVAATGIGAERAEPNTACEIQLRDFTRITLTMLDRGTSRSRG